MALARLIGVLEARSGGERLEVYEAVPSGRDVRIVRRRHVDKLVQALIAKRERASRIALLTRVARRRNGTVKVREPERDVGHEHVERSALGGREQRRRVGDDRVVCLRRVSDGVLDRVLVDGVAHAPRVQHAQVVRVASRARRGELGAQEARRVLGKVLDVPPPTRHGVA